MEYLAVVIIFLDRSWEGKSIWEWSVGKLLDAGCEGYFLTSVICITSIYAFLWTHQTMIPFEQLLPPCILILLTFYNRTSMYLINQVHSFITRNTLILTRPSTRIAIQITLYALLWCFNLLWPFSRTFLLITGTIWYFIPAVGTLIKAIQLFGFVRVFNGVFWALFCVAEFLFIDSSSAVFMWYTGEVGRNGVDT